MTHELVEKLVKNKEENKVEKPLEIEEYEGVAGEVKDKVEWKTSKRGELTKDWPLAYAENEEMKLKARFGVTAATRSFIKNKLEGEPTVVGKTTVGAVAIEFKGSVAAIAKQLEEHPEYFETAEIKASANLPSEVRYQQMSIKWKWTGKARGMEFSQELGTSSHNLYLTYAKALGTEGIYFTLLAYGTEKIEEQSKTPSEAEAVEGAWKGFVKPVSGEPKVNYKIYDPKTGLISSALTELRYYEHLPTVGETLKNYITLIRGRLIVAVGRKTARQLLEFLSGECGAWQRAFGNVLQAEGIQYHRVFVRVKFGANEAKVCEVAGTCAMLVKQWEFEGAGTGMEPFPYEETELKDQEGALGQGVDNPPSYFYNHQIVEVKGKVYDPSYGTKFEGPLGFLGEGLFGAGAETKELKENYQITSIAGYCRLVVETRGCVKKALTVLALEFKELMLAEGKEEEEAENQKLE